MKKEYTKPSIEVQNVEIQNILAGSLTTPTNSTPTVDDPEENNQFGKHTNIWQSDED